MNHSLAQYPDSGFLISELTVGIPNLPTELVDYRIVQLTDLHYGPVTKLAHLEKAAAVTRRLNPDLLVITGDFLQLANTELRYVVARAKSGLSQGQAQSLTSKTLLSHMRKVKAHARDLRQLFSSLSPPDGIIAIWGNHDYIESKSIIGRCLKSEMRFLNNESRVISRGSSRISVTGIDDHIKGKPCLTTAYQSLKQNPPATFNLLLAHNPDIVMGKNSRLIKHFDLMLSGHTHGGQIRLPKLRPIVTQTKQKKHVTGLSQFGKTLVYVANGVGFGAITLRTFCPPEIVVIKLVDVAHISP